MIWVIIIIIAIFTFFFIINKWKKKSFVKLFNRGNVMVSGMKGRGKDMAFCIVINEKKKNYISNVQYSDPKKKYQKFDFDTKVWELAGNTYKDLITGEIKPYNYPYPDGIDYYISDAGIYYPAQYQGELVKRYQGAPLFQALSRHLGDCCVHCNSQKQNRVWDKIREQSDTYIVMKKCLVIPKTKFVWLKAYSYELEESAEKQIKMPWFGVGKKAREAKNQFQIIHGEIKKHTFLTRIPYKYDSRRFKRILENNCKDYEEEE